MQQKLLQQNLNVSKCAQTRRYYRGQEVWARKREDGRDTWEGKERDASGRMRHAMLVLLFIASVYNEFKLIS